MAKRNFDIKKRGIAVRRTKSVYLIITEGKNKTETLYFLNFQNQDNDFIIKIVKAGNNTDAQSLFKTITDKWNEFGLSESDGDKAFVVVDMDNDQRKAKMVQDLIRENNNPSLSFIVSNPVFEIWFLLHYRYTTKFYKDGDDVIKDLMSFMPDYVKNKDCYPYCHDRLHEAIKNCDKLEKYYGSEKWPSVNCNPRTDVGLLLKILLASDDGTV